MQYGGVWVFSFKGWGCQTHACHIVLTGQAIQFSLATKIFRLGNKIVLVGRVNLFGTCEY
jgi:hypothetical protein